MRARRCPISVRIRALGYLSSSLDHAARKGPGNPHRLACDAHAPLYKESEPSLTFAHMPLPKKQQSETHSEYLGQFQPPRWTQQSPPTQSVPAGYPFPIQNIRLDSIRRPTYQQPQSMSPRRLDYKREPGLGPQRTQCNTIGRAGHEIVFPEQSIIF